MGETLPTARSTPGGHGLGWRGPSPRDPRDYRYTPAPRQAPLPAGVDFRVERPHQVLAVRNQEDEGSCTAFAATAMAYQTYVADGWHNPFPPSPRFTYYTERQILQAQYGVATATAEDTGGYGRAVVQALAQYGITNEHNCPYAPDGNPLDVLATAPDAETYANAYKHRATIYSSVAQDLASMQACLADGYGFIVGILVYQSFEGPQAGQTGNVPMPAPGETLLGGHELWVCGYRDTDQRFIVQNSWGTDWGDGGYIYLPFAYLADSQLASDVWTLRVQH